MKLLIIILLLLILVLLSSNQRKSICASAHTVMKFDLLEGDTTLQGISNMNGNARTLLSDTDPQLEDGEIQTGLELI